MQIKIIGLVLCASAGAAHANGFVLADHGAKATGRADAVVATGTDGSAIVHNVAGIAFQEGINIYIGANLIAPSASFIYDVDGSTTDATTSPAFTPQLYLTSRVHDLVTVGVGLHTPFGLALEWPADSPAADEIRAQALRTIFITPSVGINLDQFVPGLAVGAGLDLVPSTVQLEQDFFFGAETGSAELVGDAFGVGGRIGAMWTPKFLPKASFGAMWRSKVQLDFDGDGDFDAPAPYRSQLPPDGAITAALTLPQQVNLGAAYRPAENVEVELNAVWMGWSSLDKIDLGLPDGSVSVLPRDYEDTVTIRLGAEYDMPKMGAAFRVGYMYDPSPIPTKRLTSSLPDIDRHNVTAGGSYKFGDRYNVDLGFLWVTPGSRRTADTMNEPQLKGKFEVTAFVTALSFGAKFGK